MRGSKSGRREGRHPAVLPSCLVLLTLLAYANSFSAGFTFDSKGLILEDPRVHAATAGNVDLILQRSYWFPHGESGLYRPLTTLSYLFNYAVAGNAERPAGYHAVNLLLHVTNVLLLFALVSQLAVGRVAAFAAAAVWAVHPLTTEAVTNIVGRADLLAATGVLGGLLAYVRSTTTTGARRAAWLAVLAALGGVGICSKESAVALVPVLVLYEIARWRPRRSVGALGAGLLAVAAPFALYFAQRAAVLGTAPAAEFPFPDNPIVGASAWLGRLTALDVLARYLWLSLWPARLSADYSYDAIPLATGALRDWAMALAIVALAAAVAASRRRDRAALFAGGFALVTLLPASNLIVLSGTIMAERLTYLPLAGLIALVVVWLAPCEGTEKRRLVTIASVASVIAILGTRTIVRNGDWRDDVTLWSATVAVVPMSAKAHHALAEALFEADPVRTNIDRVIAESDRSLAIAARLPDERKPPQNYRQAATYALEQGDHLARRAPSGDLEPTPEAAAAYRRALDRLQQYLAIVAAQTAGRADARAETTADADRLIAALHLRLREPAPALRAANAARALDPRSPVAYRAAAAALLDLDRADEAAVTLAAGILATRDAGLGAFLANLYRGGLDTEGCAVRMSPAGATLNPACAIVHRHFCAADPGNVEFGCGR